MDISKNLAEFFVEASLMMQGNKFGVSYAKKVGGDWSI